MRFISARSRSTGTHDGRDRDVSARCTSTHLVLKEERDRPACRVARRDPVRDLEDVARRPRSVGLPRLPMRHHHTHVDHITHDDHSRHCFSHEDQGRATSPQPPHRMLRGPRRQFRSHDPRRVDRQPRPTHHGQVTPARRGTYWGSGAVLRRGRDVEHRPGCDEENAEGCGSGTTAGRDDCPADPDRHERQGDGGESRQSPDCERSTLRFGRYGKFPLILAFD